MSDRDDLMELCLAGIVAQQYWSDRDSAKAQRQLGEAYALLKAGCKFEVLNDESTGLVTDAKTIWVRITYKGFRAFEAGELESDDFYIPTRARLDAAMVQRDWY